MTPINFSLTVIASLPCTNYILSRLQAFSKVFSIKTEKKKKTSKGATDHKIPIWTVQFSKWQQKNRNWKLQYHSTCSSQWKLPNQYLGSWTCSRLLKEHKVLNRLLWVDYQMPASLLTSLACSVYPVHRHGLRQGRGRGDKSAGESSSMWLGQGKPHCCTPCQRSERCVCSGLPHYCYTLIKYINPWNLNN